MAYDSPTEHFGLKGVLERPSIGSAKIPSIVFCVFQLMFAAITYVHAFFLSSSVLIRRSLAP
jgi:Amt family ammonium transporter